MVRWRDVPFLLLLILALGGLAGFAWLTQNPTAEILVTAQDWPGVGPLAARFRRAYLPPEPLPPPVAGPDTIIVVKPVDRAGAVGKDPARSPATQTHVPPPLSGHDDVWVLPGMKLRREPSAEAPVILEMPAIANLQQLERRGDWYRVWRDGVTGWVLLEGYDQRMNQGEPPLGNAPEPPRPLAPTPPDPTRLARARAILGSALPDRGERQLALGPYTLYTDGRDDSLVAFLATLAAQLDALYTERYGCQPLGMPQGAVVLYQEESAYRQLQGASDRLHGLTATGHAVQGFAALFIGQRSRLDVGSTLIHELVHLINRRALGPALPPWLDEGIADDLALSEMTSDGRIHPQRLSSDRRAEGSRVTILGGEASLLHLRDLALSDDWFPVEQLLLLEWEAFVRSPRSSTFYAESALFVRYLLTAQDGNLRAPFQAFLAGIAVGEPATASALRTHLGQSWAQLEAGFRVWISMTAG